MRARAGALLETVAAVLAGLLTHTLGPEAYEKAIAPLTGNGLHVAGATLLAAIDRDGGLQAVFAVMRDPRRVLLAYDRAARNRDGGSPFSYALATQIALMGDR